MQETITKISQQITDYWNGFDKKQKIKIGIILFLLLFVLGMVIYITTRPQMVTLFSGLEYKQAAQIQDKLDEISIYNHTARNGTAIEVKKDDLDRAKLALAKENVPKAGFTFEDALANGMGTTETEKRAKLKYAKEQELGKNIASIEGIENAEVNLVIPNEDNFFLESHQKARASVKVDLRNSLNSKQVMGIVHFVVGSVENLDPQNVKVIDNQGNILYIGDENTGITGNMDEQQERKLLAEKEVEKKVISALGPLFDDVRVTPNLTINFDQHTEKQEIVSSPFEDSTKGIVSHEKKESRKVENGADGVEPGLGANNGEIPTYQMGNQNVSKAQENKSEITYEVNKRNTETIKSIGNIVSDQSSLSVIVYRDKIFDQTVKEKERKQGTQDSKDDILKEDETWEDYKYRIKKEPTIIDIEKDYPGLKDVVAKATGINSSNVELMGYEIPVFVDQEVVKKPISDYIPIIILLVLIGLLAYALIKKTEPHEITEIEPELSVEDMLESAKMKEEDVDPIEYGEDSEIRRQIEKFVDEKPEAVASLLRNWLSEEWE